VSCVGRREHIERGAVFYLPGEISSSAEAENNADPSFAGKPWANFREGIGQVRGGCYD
jgi:hypothetical protein